MLLGISPVTPFPPRQRTRSSVMFPMFSGKRPENPAPFIGHPKKFCRLVSFAISFGISPLIEAVLKDMIISLLMLPNRKSPIRPRSLGFPGVHKENKFRIFQMLEGRKPSKLLYGNTILLMYDVLLWQVIPYQEQWEISLLELFHPLASYHCCPFVDLYMSSKMSFSCTGVNVVSSVKRGNSSIRFRQSGPSASKNNL